MQLFTPNDFKIFGIPGFHERMAAIRLKIRPKLASIGEELVPKLSPLVDLPLYVHVAKHARRTVNPPDDTWTAFGADQRGYKKDVHFRVAVSQHCVRFLFEAGTDYYDKVAWSRQWKRSFKEFGPDLRKGMELGWFEDEHQEHPATFLKDLSVPALKDLGEELTRRRDGQLVLGRRIDAVEFGRLSSRQVEMIAVETFKSLVPLFRLHDARVVADA